MNFVLISLILSIHHTLQEDYGPQVSSDIAYNKTVYYNQKKDVYTKWQYIPSELPNFFKYFSLMAPQWWCVDLQKFFFIDRVYVKGYWKRNHPKMLYVYLTNNFNYTKQQTPHKTGNQPCWKYGEGKGESYFVTVRKCQRVIHKGNIGFSLRHQHRFVVFWVPANTTFYLYDLVVYQMENFAYGREKNSKKFSNVKFSRPDDLKGFNLVGENPVTDLTFSIELRHKILLDRVYLRLLIPIDSVVIIEDCVEFSPSKTGKRSNFYKLVDAVATCPRIVKDEIIVRIKRTLRLRVSVKAIEVFGSDMSDLHIARGEDAYQSSTAQVSVSGLNIARGKDAYQSSTAQGYFSHYAPNAWRYTDADLALDPDPNLYSSTLPNPKSSNYWVVDLGRPYQVMDVKVCVNGEGEHTVLLLHNFTPLDAPELDNNPECRDLNTWMQPRMQGGPIKGCWKRFCSLMIPPHRWVSVVNPPEIKRSLIISEVSISSPLEMCPIGTFGLFCMRECHCRHYKPCPPKSGSCLNGCKRGWYGKACNRVHPQYDNVALYKPAFQSSTKNGGYEAGRAVDDNTFPTCQATHYDDESQYPWLLIDLESYFQIREVTVLFHIYGKTRVGHIRFYAKELKSEWKKCKDLKKVKNKIKTGAYNKNDSFIDTVRYIYNCTGVFDRYLKIYTVKYFELRICDVTVSTYNKTQEPQPKKSLIEFVNGKVLKQKWKRPYYMIYYLTPNVSQTFVQDLGRQYCISFILINFMIKRTPTDRYMEFYLMNQYDLKQPQVIHPSSRLILKTHETSLNYVLNNLSFFKDSESLFRYIGFVQPIGMYGIVTYLLPYIEEYCSAGLYGVDCSKECHCKDMTPCTVEEGICSSGCEEGWMGDACNYRKFDPMEEWSYEESFKDE